MMNPAWHLGSQKIFRPGLAFDQLDMIETKLEQSHQHRELYKIGK